MKKILCYICLTTFFLLSACSRSAAGTPSPIDSLVPSGISPTPSAEQNETGDAATRAENYAAPLIEVALAALEGSHRNDLSTITYTFEEEYSYSGPTDEQTELYSSANQKYVEDDDTYFDAVCDMVVENMPQDASAYDKYRYLAFFLSEATDYDYKGKSGLMSITPYGAIVQGGSICLGYATAYLYLCEKADLWCRCVYGYSENGIHSWNLVKLEDGTYYVDVTWCDGLGAIGTDGWQKYFMLTEDVILQDHSIWTGGPATGTTIFD